MDRGTIVMGAGLAGLSSAYLLSRSGRNVVVIEADPAVGGLSKTIVWGEFRFDLGGHRFLTKNREVEEFVKEILDREFLIVHRKSKIYMYKRFFDYPLRVSNAIFGLGLATTIKAISDYTKERIKAFCIPSDGLSLEDWVVSNFGRTLFNIYFKDYSEKVWGIECRRISQEWVAQRIRGLSLGKAIKNAIFRFTGKDIATLADTFIYPPNGIGEISERLREAIERRDRIFTETRIERLHHRDSVIRSVTTNNCNHREDIEGSHFISSIPLTELVRILDPPPPDEIMDAVSRLRYRDLVIVTIMINRERITDLTWLYLPEKDMPIGRIHEPKNWSERMAPEGKTHLVCEYFCFKGDEIWNKDDEELVSNTILQLERINLINRNEVVDACVLRIPKAYPLFEVGYNEPYERVMEYLSNFKNLHVIGRGGRFRYYNMDHAIESGIEAAKKVMDS
jgi:protoporphyrinogen oxidase